MKTLLKVENLTKIYPRISWWPKTKSERPAIQGVSFALKESEILGIVGESGSGKSSLALALSFIDPPTTGRVFFQQQDLATLSSKQFKQIRRKISFVFQDAGSTLDPSKKIFEILAEPWKIHQQPIPDLGSICEQIQLSRRFLQCFPGELSQGQRQRIGVARALSTNPKLLIADEPINSLDVITGSQILGQLLLAKREQGLTAVIVTHNLGVVKALCDHLLVVFRGQVVESARVSHFFKQPLHPYSQMLLSSKVPRPLSPQSKAEASDSRQGCSFLGACSLAMPICREKSPQLGYVGENKVACHYYSRT